MEAVGYLNNSHERAVADIERMLKAMDKPLEITSKPLKKKMSSQLQAKLDNALMMSIRDNKDYVVIEQGNQIYQTWPKATAEKWGCEYVKLEDYECD